jgi:hypothetical protein
MLQARACSTRIIIIQPLSPFVTSRLGISKMLADLREVALRSRIAISATLRLLPAMDRSSASLHNLGCRVKSRRNCLCRILFQRTALEAQTQRQFQIFHTT